MNKAIESLEGRKLFSVTSFDDGSGTAQVIGTSGPESASIVVEEGTVTEMGTTVKVKVNGDYIMSAFDPNIVGQFESVAVDMGSSDDVVSFTFSSPEIFGVVSVEMGDGADYFNGSVEFGSTVAVVVANTDDGNGDDDDLYTLSGGSYATLDSSGDDTYQVINLRQTQATYINDMVGTNTLSVAINSPFLYSSTQGNVLVGYVSNENHFADPEKDSGYYWNDSNGSTLLISTELD